VIDPRDISAVAVTALLTDDHDNQAYTLTGPELLTTADQVARLSDVLGRPLRTFDEPDSAVRAEFLRQGMSDEFVDVVMKGWEYVREGGLAVLTEDVERALGRPATSYKQWATDHAAQFRQAVNA
ncbi:SDR family NAD(P)-dependent oxidoreductase, partial [Kibdelosporangium lantanae]